MHLPSAPLGPAHPRVLLQRLRQAHLHRRDHRRHQPTCSARRAPTPGLPDGRRGHPARGLHLPPLRQGQRLHQGGGHPGRLVRLRLHPLRLHEEGPGLLARRPCTWRAWTSTAAGSSPALLTAVGASGPGRTLQGAASPTAGPWTARARPCTSPWATAWTPMTSSTSTARTCSVCGPASADYHADMRCSDEIFKQLSQNYLKFRNTARYCLGNLDGFDPDHLVAPAGHAGAGPLGRHPAQRSSSRSASHAYDNYEFHVVSHAVNDFCVVELSNFYLDIIKDRLYCEEHGRPGPPLRPDRPVPDPGHHDQAVGPHPGLHLRRDLAGHAPRGRATTAATWSSTR